MKPYIPVIRQDDGSNLVHQMFVDRAKMFRDRLKWDVTVNDLGEERDQYDTSEAQYVILVDDKSRHRASCRLLPVADRCMTVEAFPGLFTRDMIKDADTAAEVTRFCVMGGMSESLDLSAKLLIEGAHWLESTHYTSFIAVFYRSMLPIYRRSGWAPRIVNKKGPLYVGQWSKNDYGKWEPWPRHLSF